MKVLIYDAFNYCLRKYRVFLLLSLASFSVVGFASRPSSDEFIPLTEFEVHKTYLPIGRIPRDFPWILPPAKFTPDDQKKMFLDVLKDSAQELQIMKPEKIRFFDTREWSNYINFDHFVPAAADGAPKGHGFNFSYYTQGFRDFPWAEIDETGTLLIWQNPCNFFYHVYSKTLSKVEVSKQCSEDWKPVAKHELRHFSQWLNLYQKLGESDTLRLWTDIGHYHCREIEVYVNQFHLNEHEPADWVMRDSFLTYFEGCEQSPYAEEFASFLKDAKYFISKHTR